MTATKQTFANMTEIFERVYEQLREDNGENAPNSNLYYAETVQEIADQRGREIEPKDEVEIGGGDTVGYIFDLNNDNLYRIGTAAGDNEILTVFARIMGYDL